MRCTSIFFHPTSAPSVEHVTTTAGDAVLLDAGGMAFTFRDQAELDAWVDQVCVASAASRAENEGRLLEACRKVLAAQPQEGLVGGDILAHQGSRS
jgi:hypothetical protein